MKPKIIICMQGGLITAVGTVGLPECDFLFLDHDAPNECEENDPWLREYHKAVNELNLLETAGQVTWQY